MQSYNITNIMGACAGCTEPKRRQRTNKQLKNSRNDSSFRPFSTNLSKQPTKQKYRQNKEFSPTVLQRTQSVQIHRKSLYTNKNILVQDQSTSLFRKPTFEDFLTPIRNLRKQEPTQEYSRVENQNRRIQTQQKQPSQQYMGTFSSINYQEYSRVVSNNQLSMPLKKRELQTIEEMINDQVKTPQYIRDMRNLKKQQIEVQDAVIDFQGIVPPFNYISVYDYLKDVQSISKLEGEQVY